MSGYIDVYLVGLSDCSHILIRKIKYDKRGTWTCNQNPMYIHKHKQYVHE